MLEQSGKKPLVINVSMANNYSVQLVKIEIKAVQTGKSAQGFRLCWVNSAVEHHFTFSGHNYKAGSSYLFYAPQTK
jgi:hypothetical protein